ncbi:hypothetical protein ACJIZ3_022576 [Penstemon smallii]|uniref:Xrn1 helical domain-containing protein n=1 Tax=Penstemon smallii TaxID=265156 RepID=A0ABD3TNQ6_9LAMI
MSNKNVWSLYLLKNCLIIVSSVAFTMTFYLKFRYFQEQMTWNSHSGHRPANMLSFEKQSDISANHANSKAGLLIDKVKLGEDGWKERYYSEKFEVQTNDDCEKVKKDAVFKYVEGICWIMHYYYQGVCSWQWYYPYHYAPFASDFHGLDELNIHFALGKPFKPFDQLMGVLPAASAQALPFSYRKLMTDSSSPILDFYPTEFELDLNGRKQNWKAVCKLPFIDESRLLTEIASVEHTLTDEEKRRNTLGLDKLFFHISHPIAAKIFDFAERNKDNPRLCQAKVKRKINPMLSAGMNGYICISDKPICPSEISSPLCDMERIMKNDVLFVFYKLPDFHAHIPRPPDGVSMPEKSISQRDLLRPPTLWHEKIAVVESRFTRRSIPPKSVAGPFLAKLAYELVSETYRLSSSEDHGEVSVVPNSEDHGKVSVVPSSEDQGKVSVLSSENHGKSASVVPSSEDHGKVSVSPSSEDHGKVSVSPSSEDHGKVSVLSSENHGKSATNEDHGEVGKNKHTLDRRDRRKRMKLRKLMASLDSETHEKVNGSSDDHGKVIGSNEDHGKVKGSSEDHEKVKGSIEDHEKVSRSNEDHGKANGSAEDLGEDEKNKRTLVRREKRKRMKLRKLMASLESENREKVNGSSDDHGKINGSSEDHEKSEQHEKVNGSIKDREKANGSTEDHGKVNESIEDHGKVNGCTEDHGEVNGISEDGRHARRVESSPT